MLFQMANQVGSLQRMTEKGSRITSAPLQILLGQRSIRFQNQENRFFQVGPMTSSVDELGSAARG